jgi:hypothetical protein
LSSFDLKKSPLQTFENTPSLQETPNRVEHRIELPNWPLWYWAAVQLGPKETRDAAALMLTKPRTTFLITDQHNQWKTSAEKVAQEVEVEKRVRKDWNLNQHIFDTVARLVAGDELLIQHHDPAYKRDVLAVYGKQERIQQYIATLTQLTTIELVEPKNMWDKSIDA